MSFCKCAVQRLVLFALLLLVSFIGTQTASAQTETAPDAKSPFFAETCENLFRQEDPAYLRPMDEMPLMVTFMLGFYTAKGEANGLELIEIANRSDIIPALIEHCRAVPKDSYIAALLKTVPTPLEAPLENPTPMLFGAPCSAAFGPPPKTFLRTPLEFTLIQHFTIGYYSAANEALDPADLAGRRNLMVDLYDQCMQDLEQPMIQAIAATVPAS